MAHLLEYILINCINYFLIAVTKHLIKKQLEEGLILAHSSGLQSIIVREGMATGA